MVKWNCDWTQLDPIFSAPLLCGLATLEHDNIDVCIPSDGGKRSDAMQIALGAQGRQSLDIVNLLRNKAGMLPIDDADNAYTVTNCDGINEKSAHQKGQAADVVPMVNGEPVWPDGSDPRWKVIHDALVSQGLESGQDWQPPFEKDYPHYQKKGA